MELKCKCGSNKLRARMFFLDDFISMRYVCYDCEGTVSVDYKPTSISYFTNDLELIDVEFIRGK